MNLITPTNTPQNFNAAVNTIRTMNPGCSTEDAMKAAVRKYPELHAAYLKLPGSKTEAELNRERVADAVQEHVAAAKKEGVSLGYYLKKHGIM